MEKPVKILAIGNSFSEDATFYLHALASAGEKNMILGRLYIGGCPLSRHWENVRTGEAAYVYNHTGREEGPSSIETALKAADWDYVTLQQASPYSGLYESYHPYLENLSAYVRVLCPRAKQVIHQTWAYEKTSEHPGFASYQNDQGRMYEALRYAYNKAAQTINAHAFLPVGDAWQLARETKIGDTLCRDGFHGNEKGRYLGAAVWYEVLLGGDIRSNPFCPPEIPQKEWELLRDCVRQAVEARA